MKMKGKLRWDRTFRKLETFGKFLMLSAFCFCQLTTTTAQIADSLATLLLTAPADTHRVTLLTDLAWEINESETDQAEAKIWRPSPWRKN